MNKIKILIIGIALFTCFQSCKKKEEAATTNVINTIPPSDSDSISYNDLRDTVINSIKDIVPCQFGGTMPIPNDSTAIYLLDIDLDQNYDFSIQASTNSNGPNSPSSPCVSRFGYSIYIQSLNNNEDSVSVKDLSCKCSANMFSLGAPINYTLKYSNISYISLSCYLCPFINPISGDIYLAIKKTTNTKTMYGWIRVEKTSKNGLTIKDFAINKTNNKAILCGQSK